MSEPNERRIEHLFLLVGGNPLPNAVAARHLTNTHTGITLVHSQGSGPVAGHLASWLRNQGLSNVARVQVRESDPLSIATRVRERMQSIGATQIGLSYTGGTKAMSVHAYRAVEKWAVENGATAVFTYLDPRELRMVFDPEDPDSGGRGHSECVARTVKMGLEDLLALHGWSLLHEPTTVPILPHTAETLAMACAADDLFEAWKGWLCNELVAKCRRPDHRDWKSKTQLSSLRLELPQDGSLDRLTDALRHELGVTTPEIVP